MKVQIVGAAGQNRPEPKSQTTETMVRMRSALWLLVVKLSLSLVLVVLGVYTTTRTQSLNVTGFIPGVFLTLGSFLGLLGLRLEENRKQLLTASIVFLSFGIIAAFLCVMIDGVCIILNMDMRPLRAERCQYYSSGNSYIYETFYTSVPCWNLDESCTMTVRSGTCYCCDLYDCANGGYLSNYYEFVGIQSCEEVLTLYILIWILTVLNLVASFTGILVTAVLGSIKDTRTRLPVTEASKSPITWPTAPQLMDTNTHTVQRLYPDTPMYFPPAENRDASQNHPPSSSTSPHPHLEPSRPPPFTPATSPLLFTVRDVSA